MMKRDSSHLKVVDRQDSLAKECEIAIETKNLNVRFSKSHVLKNINAKFYENSVTSVIGPSGSGKSTLIRSLNRINDTVSDFLISGEIEFCGADIYSKNTDVNRLRKDIGMIFQKPCIFPKSIFENVLFGARHFATFDKETAEKTVEENLRAVSLWKEVKERLGDKATTLSIGQQQRLCIARSLAVKPKVILMDEPTSALDHISSMAIENLTEKLKEDYSIVFVTHNREQAKRLSDHVIFICDGKVIEQGSAEAIFNNPKGEQTKDYLKWNSCECD